MVNTRENPRHTVAGLLLREKGGGHIEIGFHWPKNSLKSARDERHVTTVGGGIQIGETAQRAMRRELGQEYGENFAKACKIEPLDLGFKEESDFISETSSGAFKRYHWFTIRPNEFCEPVPNTLEVVHFGWSPINDLDLIAFHLGSTKRKMVQAAIRTATGIPVDLQGRAVAVA